MGTSGPQSRPISTFRPAYAWRFKSGWRMVGETGRGREARRAVVVGAMVGLRATRRGRGGPTTIDVSIDPQNNQTNHARTEEKEKRDEEGKARKRGSAGPVNPEVDGTEDVPIINPASPPTRQRTLPSSHNKQTSIFYLFKKGGAGAGGQRTLRTEMENR